MIVLIILGVIAYFYIGLKACGQYLWCFGVTNTPKEILIFWLLCLFWPFFYLWIIWISFPKLNIKLWNR